MAKDSPRRPSRPSLPPPTYRVEGGIKAGLLAGAGVPPREAGVPSRPVIRLLTVCYCGLTAHSPKRPLARIPVLPGFVAMDESKLCPQTPGLRTRRSGYSVRSVPVFLPTTSRKGSGHRPFQRTRRETRRTHGGAGDRGDGEKTDWHP